MVARAAIAIALGGFALFVAPSAYAQTGTGESDVRATLRELKAELSALRATVSDLKSQLDATRAELRWSRAGVAVSQNEVVTQEPPSRLVNARDVQLFLKNFPDVYPEGRVTGYYGDLTRKAIRAFQEKYGGSTNDARVKEFYELVFGGAPPTPFTNIYSPLVPAVLPAISPPLASTSPTVVATTSPVMQRVICPALPTVTACASNEDKVVSYASAACGTYYTCVPRGTVIATSTAASATSTTGTAGWRRIAWGRGGSSLVGPNVPQSAIDAQLAVIAASCPNATQYDYFNPSDANLPDAGVPSCPAGAATSTPIDASGGCARYGEGWHAMDASGNCFDPAMQNYRDTNGGALSCASWPVSGCSGSTSYAGDANACPGFAYSRWDSQGRRYCQLNASRSCDYNYPSYLTNGANYKGESCPAESATGGDTAAYAAFTPRFTEPAGGCGQYSTQYRAMLWVIHSNAIGGSCVSGTRPSGVVNACPAGQWPTWDTNGWPTGCSGGGWTAAATSTSVSTPSTTTSGSTGTSSGSGATSSGTSTGGGSTSGYYGGTPPAGQKSQAWNSLGLQSLIRTDAVAARIEQLKQACASVASGANVWMPGAGDSASVDFGMPDPAKCASAAACASGQYFNGTSCGAGSSWSSGGTSSGYADCSSHSSGAHSMDSTGRCYSSDMSQYKEAGASVSSPWIACTGASQPVPYCTTGGSSSGGGSGSSSYTSGSSSSSSSCSSSLTALLGSGCHYMYSGSSGSGPMYCNSEMTLSAKEGDTAVTQGCSSPSSLLRSNSQQFASILEAARAMLVELGKSLAQ